MDLKKGVKHMNMNVVERALKAFWPSVDKLILFGMGNMGSEFVSQTKLKLPSIVYDNDEDKWGKTILGKYVIAPEKLKEIQNKDSMLVFIMGVHDEEIACQIERYGFKNWISLRYLEYRLMIESHIQNIHIKSCMIETSSLCNARCTFCINKTMQRDRMNMPNKIFEQAVVRLREFNQYPEIFWMHCLGEPLIDSELYAKIRKLKNEFPDSHIGYASNFGLASEDHIRNILDCGQDFLIISLNTNDKIEYHKLMGLDYDKTVEKIEFLLREKARQHSALDLTISIVENEKNGCEVQKFSEYWNSKKVKVRVLKEGKWVKKTKRIDESNSGGYLGHVLSGYVCQQLYQEICILSNGNYALCCFDGEGCMNLGNVMDTNLQEVFHNEERTKLIMSLMHGASGREICRECSFLK